jgi:hypothetical protein
MSIDVEEVFRAIAADSEAERERQVSELRRIIEAAANGEHPQNGTIRSLRNLLRHLGVSEQALRSLLVRTVALNDLRKLAATPTSSWGNELHGLTKQWNSECDDLSNKDRKALSARIQVLENQIRPVSEAIAELPQEVQRLDIAWEKIRQAEPKPL